MAKIIGSCGHQIRRQLNLVEVRNVKENGTRNTRKVVLCKMCERMFRKNDMLIETDSQREAWLVGGA